VELHLLQDRADGLDLNRRHLDVQDALARFEAEMFGIDAGEIDGVGDLAGHLHLDTDLATPVIGGALHRHVERGFAHLQLLFGKGLPEAGLDDRRGVGARHAFDELDHLDGGLGGGHPFGNGTKLRGALGGLEGSLGMNRPAPRPQTQSQRQGTSHHGTEFTHVRLPHDAGRGCV